MIIDMEAGIPVTEAQPVAHCPYCNSPTEMAREGGPSVVSSLNLNEIQTLVRNEWRRRLGPEAYQRRHSERLARALTVLAVHPQSPIVREQIDALVRDALSDLRAEGRGRSAAQREFWALTLALRDVLVDAGMTPEEAARILGSAQDLLAEILYLPGGARDTVE